MELKEIVGYLPYDFKGKVYNGFDDSIVEIKMSNTYINNKGHFIWFGSECKPILRPLSDLKKDEWMEIFKAGIDESVYEYCDLEIFSLGDVIRLYDLNFGMNFMLPEKTIVSFELSAKSFNSNYIFYAMKSYQELYKRHIDLYGLIEKGEAIGVSTIEK